MDALRSHQDPAQIGAHVLLARLGAGGMGQVYLGRSPGGRLVAIKVIRDEITDHPDALARFRREAETVRAVRSAYTANLIDASLDVAPYWLATEYVSGPTLSHAVRERGPFPADTCRRLFAALAEGLASVHAYGVTHRDLKPQNVILSPQGPQLIDFGIARGVTDTALTQTGMAPGTPGYTAPEVLIRNQVGPEADVFALGAAIAYAATGRPPYGSGPTDAVSYRAVHEEIDLAGGVEPQLVALIQACVAKDPAERPGVEEIIARCTVTSALADDPWYRPLADLVEAAPQDLPRAVAAGFVPRGHSDALTVGPGYVPTLAPNGAAGTQSPPERSRRRTPWLVTVAAAAVVGVTAAVVLQLMPGDGPGGREAEGQDGTGGKGGGQSKGQAKGQAKGKSPASPTAAPQKAPAFIEGNRISRDYWTLSKEESAAAYGQGQCVLGQGSDSEEQLPGELQVAIRDADNPDLPYVTGRARIGMRIKYAEMKQEKPEPYYVSVAVKSPHDIDPGTGKPFVDLLVENKRVGYTSKPVDIFSKWKSGEFIDLTYPDDFAEHVNGKTYTSIPVANDPGDWTVVFYHVKGSPTEYSRISCDGFRAK